MVCPRIAWIGFPFFSETNLDKSEANKDLLWIGFPFFSETNLDKSEANKDWLPLKTRICFFFPCSNHFLCIFAPAKPRENGMAKESAFFALFLACESAQFAQYVGIEMEEAPIIMLVKHNQWSIIHIHYFTYYGSADPTG